MEQTIHILVVDDEPDIRRILHIMLEHQGYRVHEAINGRRAVEYIRENPDTDLILMDIMMPELGGVEASREIRSISSAPILFLTAKSQERDMLQAYQSGGDDYLVKPFSSAELLMRVESLLRRYRVYKGKINGKILRQDIVLDEENRRVLRDGAAVELTETEFSILQYLAAQKGKVVSVNDIYENVWHEKYMPASNNTVMVHIVNLRKKLERTPAEPRLIRTVWERGIRLTKKSADEAAARAAGRDRVRGGGLFRGELDRRHTDREGLSRPEGHAEARAGHCQRAADLCAGKPHLLA